MIKNRQILFYGIIILVLTLVIVPGCKSTDNESPKEKPIKNSLTKNIEPPPPPPPPPPPVTWADFENAGFLYLTDRTQQAWELLQGIGELKIDSGQQKQLNFLTGLTAFKLKKTGEVEKYLADSKLIPSALQGYALYFRGRAWLDAGRPDKALALLDEYLKKHSDEGLMNRARLDRARSLFDLGQKDQAFTECRALKNTDQGDMALLIMARWHEKMNEPDQARVKYHQAMKSSNIQEVRAEAAHKYKELLQPVVDQPGRETEQLTLVRLLRTEWLLGEALALIDKLEKRGGSARFLANLSKEKGLILYYSGQLEQALEVYQKSVPSLGRTRMLARCLMRMGRWTEAAEAYADLAGQYGKSKRAQDALYEAGYCHLRANDPEKARAFWDRVGGKHQDDELWQMGLYYFRQKKIRSGGAEL